MGRVTEEPDDLWEGRAEVPPYEPDHRCDHACSPACDPAECACYLPVA